jgi:hypothetical protein
MDAHCIQNLQEIDDISTHSISAEDAHLAAQQISKKTAAVLNQKVISTLLAQ